MKVRDMVLCSMFAAITAILAQIVIPIGTIPITFQVLAVTLCGGLLGKKLGFISQVVYILLGAIGIPVYAGFSGGINVLLGPTGGYLLSYPIAAYIIGYLCKDNKITKNLFGMLLGLSFIYLVGMLQLKFVTGMTYFQAFMGGVAPFIVLDLIKVTLAGFIIHRINKTINITQLSRV